MRGERAYILDGGFQACLPGYRRGFWRLLRRVACVDKYLPIRDLWKELAFGDQVRGPA
jgi:hypothetical protein